VRRAPAAEVEALLVRAVREQFTDSTQTDDRDLIRNHVIRIEVQTDQLAVEVRTPKQEQSRGPESRKADAVPLGGYGAAIVSRCRNRANAYACSAPLTGKQERVVATGTDRTVLAGLFPDLKAGVCILRG
jgi:hypothetical protein